MKYINLVLLLPWISNALIVAPAAERLNRITSSLYSSTTKSSDVPISETLPRDDDNVISNEYHRRNKNLSNAGTSESPSNPTPSAYENSKFQCDESVELWRNYNIEGNYETQDFIRRINSVSNGFLTKGGKALSYWLRHTARSGYFATNAVLGFATSTLQQRLSTTQQSDDTGLTSARFSQSVVMSSMFAEVALAYEQDYKQIEMGRFNLPYDMYTRNRQNSPFFWTQQTGRLVNEFAAVLSRRNNPTEEGKGIWMRKAENNDEMFTSNDDIYPEYYKNAFHYQTDGWMSPGSANVYETSTETLFLGRQDSMQRTALVPLVDFAKKAKQKQQVMKRPLKVLEVACGTGRFMTFARDNLPLDTKYTAVDLSPFYLEKARDNDQNWRSIRQRVDGLNGNSIEPATFVQVKAENLPFKDEEFDIVVSMYLYHEIPRSIRARASSEMARVTRKGGKVIFTDSNQKGDRPVMDKTMGNFEKMNEPYYCDYIEDYISDHFENAGLDCLTKLVCSSTKTLTFGKPASLLHP